MGTSGIVHRHPHLQLVAEDRHFDRRRRSAPPSPPPPRVRGEFGPSLSAKLDELEQQIRAAQAATPQIQPHLIFRIPLAKGAMVDQISDRLREVNIIAVSVEPDRAVIAFRNEVDLNDFRAAIGAYVRGPRINSETGKHYKSTKWDVFEYIDPQGLKLWSREDRIGPRLIELIGVTGNAIQPNQTYVLDVEIWHRGTRDLAMASLQELRELFQVDVREQGTVLDHFVGDHLCLARVRVTGALLSLLLDLDAIAEVELPPVPQLNLAEVRNVRARDFQPIPPPNPSGPRLCIVDSGLTSNHPLLARNVAAVSSEMSSTTSAADEHGHGTMIGGLAVFGSIRACYSTGVFASPIRLFSVRVLDANNRFDDEKLVVNQIEAAIMQFYQAPHNCRIFNLSVGTAYPAFTNGVDRQTVWAESMDILARELKVLLVISAGNLLEIFGMGTDDAESLVKSYPSHLLTKAAGLNDPSTAAIAVTVGSLAEHDVVALRNGTTANDIVRAIARKDHPSPFTRCGHGVNGAIKPEFIDYGGNAVFAGTLSLRRIGKDAGTSVMSLSNKPLEQLFRFDVGTSLAAPLVARTAALAWDQLQTALNYEPHPNLVRAVLASAAKVPPEVSALFSGDKDATFRVAGYGRVVTENALTSSDHRVTMVAQGTIGIDTFAIYAVPITDEFVGATGKKRIRVAMAFDPPVRRRRMDYLGVMMNFQMIRGKTLPEVIAAFEAVGPDEDAEEAISQPHNIPFDPKGRPLKEAYRRNASTLQVGSFEFERGGARYGDTYWLLVRSQRKWAPAEVERQDYAVAVTLEAYEDELYNSISLRLQQRTRVRGRARV
jgi:subtilase family protein